MSNTLDYLPINLIELALAEDIGHGDLTAALLLESAIVSAEIVSQQQAVICGTALVDYVFYYLDPTIKLNWLVEDGQFIENGQVLCRLTGPARGILTGERTALNFLQTLSSTATLTRQFVQALKQSPVKLLDTRKTLPGLRLAQKYAVRCGGGQNHRLNLADAILIKENHITAIGSIEQAIRQARQQYPTHKLEIEVKNLTELQQLLPLEVNVIMLDNFSLALTKQAVSLRDSYSIANCPQGGVAKVNRLESSGGINLENIRDFAQTGVDYISVGSITKLVKPIELSLLVTLPDFC